MTPDGPENPARALTPFDEAAFARRRQRAGLSLGAPAVVVVETGSTNDDALASVREGTPHGAVFVADAQTHGRGRRGHTWTSPPAANLTFSILLRPLLPADRVALLALLAGLAVRTVVARRVPSHVTVKWPNDVVVGRKKVAGILVESRLSGSAVEAVVVGIGLNVHMRALPPDIAEIATSLALLGAVDQSRETLLVEILATFEAHLGRFAAEGLRPVIGELRAHDALLGEGVRVGDVTGVGAGLDEDGSLLVRDAHGAVHRVNSGTVERL